jgi:hypothetical protein
MEEDQLHKGAVIRNPHPVGLTFHPRRQVFQHAYLYRGDAAWLGGCQSGSIAAIYNSDWQIKR